MLVLWSHLKRIQVISPLEEFELPVIWVLELRVHEEFGLEWPFQNHMLMRKERQRKLAGSDRSEQACREERESHVTERRRWESGWHLRLPEFPLTAAWVVCPELF